MRKKDLSRPCKPDFEAIPEKKFGTQFRLEIFYPVRDGTWRNTPFCSRSRK